MLRSSASQKLFFKEKFKRRKIHLDSKSKDKKSRRMCLKESKSSQDSHSQKKETIREKESELGNICERKGIGEKQKDNDEYFCYRQKTIKSKKYLKNKSQTSNKLFTNVNETNPSWNYISYVQAREGKDDSIKNLQPQQKVRIGSSRGSLGFINKSIRESRMETNQKKKLNPETIYKGKLSPKNKRKRKYHESRKKQDKSTKFRKSKSRDQSTGRKKSEKKKQSKDKQKKEKKSDKKLNQVEQKITPSPIKMIKLQDINFKQLHEDLENEELNLREYLLSPEQTKQRCRSLNMLGKISSSMNLKRQTHSLAITYIDRFLDSSVDPKMIKTIGIAALMMALKIDHAETVGTLVHQFSSVNSFQAVSQSTDKKSQKKKTQPSEEHQDTPHLRFNLNRPKQPNIFTTVLSCEEIFSEYDHILCKEEIADMEMQMMIKLNFKMAIRSFVYWIDSLSLIWDSFIYEFYPSLRAKLLYRQQKSITNYSYLSQLTEIAFYSVESYIYSRVLIVLSFMYIITRVSLEFGDSREEKGFDTYKINLAQSSNILFIDKLGVNELFGKFLSLYNMDMGDIVNCCQYVSKFLNYKMLRIYSPVKPQSILEPIINVYQYNPELYRYVFTKLYQ